MITSLQNTKIKWVRSLQASSRARRQERAFVLEGVRLAEEALSGGAEVRLVLYSDELGERGKKVFNGFASRGAPIEKVSPSVMRHASDTQTPQGILVVLPFQTLPLPDDLDFVFIPDSIRDPGNLGGMLRSAAAAGVNAVLLPPGTVDAYAPKVVRSAMGAHLRLPIRQLSWDEIEGSIDRLNIYLPDASAGISYLDVDLRSPLALIIGGEAGGASARAHKLALTRLHIPMVGDMESLNAAVAAGILMFEVVRQRAQPGK
jgi:TrmH family RNA methyltransferase